MIEQPHPHVLAAARHCGRCPALIVFGRLDTGKLMPFNVDTDPDGNVAVHVTGSGQIRARVLSAERSLPEGTERLHVPHWATCGRTHVATPRRTDGAVPLYVARAKKQAERGRPARPVPDGGLW